MNTKNPKHYIELYDKVKLTNGSIATIVEILSNNEVYIADVEVDDDYDTKTIYQNEICEIIK